MRRPRFTLPPKLPPADIELVQYGEMLEAGLIGDTAENPIQRARRTQNARNSWEASVGGSLHSLTSRARHSCSSSSSRGRAATWNSFSSLRALHQSWRRPARARYPGGIAEYGWRQACRALHKPPAGQGMECSPWIACSSRRAGGPSWGQGGSSSLCEFVDRVRLDPLSTAGGELVSSSSWLRPAARSLGERDRGLRRQGFIA